MRYIERILQPGETVLYSGKIHWIVYLPSLAMWAAAVVALLAGAAFPPVLAVAALCAIVGFAVFFQAWFRRWTTEIDVTNRRIVYKRGLINRHTVEMNMDKVESVDVDQSIMGRLLDYGDITVRGTGETMEVMRGIGAPLDFRNHVTAR
jgi:uncharacterized membrane protein YdbT with pleckstrin-like domain